MLVAHTVCVFAQSALAGEFLSGTDSIVKFHEWAGWAILAICALQITLVAVMLRSSHASLWLLIGSVLILLAEILQTGSGYGRFLRVHIPLGVFVFGAVGAQMMSQFRKTTPAPGSPQ